MNNKHKRKKYKIVNKFKFIRFIICSLILLIIVIQIVCSSFNNQSVNTINTINEVNINDELTEIEIETELLTNHQPSLIVENCAYTDKNIYSMKPDALSDTHFNWIIEISNNEEVPLEVILAIITTENETYNIKSVCKNSNGTIDMGLCQINSAYVDYFANKYDIYELDPYNVYDAVTFVARHIKYLSTYGINEYDLSEMDSYIFAAGAYNRGLYNECKYRNMYHYKEKFLINYDKFI